jgi:hypothetical protein
MAFDIIPDDEALALCACCQTPIDDHMELSSVGARLRSDVDLSPYEGHCIQIRLASEGREVFTMVSREGSEAKKEGNDCMFLVCSEKCENDLKAALAEDIAAGTILSSLQEGAD